MQAAMLSHQDTVQCRFNASVLSVTQKDLTLVEKKLCQDVKKLNVFCWFFFFFFFPSIFAQARNYNILP